MLRRALVAVLLCTLPTLLAARAGAHPEGDDREDTAHEHAHDHGDGAEHEHGAGAGHDHSVTTPTVPGARVVDVEASSFAFAPKRITIGVAEDVTISLRSKDVLHDFVVQDVGHVAAAKKKPKQGGLRLHEPGTFRFWCSVPGHRAEGMRGTIVVEEPAVR
jgi:plastocyanin